MQAAQEAKRCVSAQLLRQRCTSYRQRCSSYFPTSTRAVAKVSCCLCATAPAVSVRFVLKSTLARVRSPAPVNTRSNSVMLFILHSFKARLGLGLPNTAMRTGIFRLHFTHGLAAPLPVPKAAYVSLSVPATVPRALRTLCLSRAPATHISHALACMRMPSRMQSQAKVPAARRAYKMQVSAVSAASCLPPAESLRPPLSPHS